MVTLNEYNYGLETYTEGNKVLEDVYIPEWELDGVYEDLLDYGLPKNI